MSEKVSPWVPVPALTEGLRGRRAPLDQPNLTALATIIITPNDFPAGYAGSSTPGIGIHPHTLYSRVIKPSLVLGVVIQ